MKNKKHIRIKSENQPRTHASIVMSPECPHESPQSPDRPRERESEREREKDSVNKQGKSAHITAQEHNHTK